MTFGVQCLLGLRGEAIEPINTAIRITKFSEGVPHYFLAKPLVIP